MTETRKKPDKEAPEQQQSEEKNDEAPVCTTATVAEHSRLDNEDEPCDDGRAGK